MKAVAYASATGARDDRADPQRLLADATRGVARVIVQQFDRAARSVKKLVATLEHLRGCGIDFAPMKQDVDTSTPDGELIPHVRAVIGRIERALIGERIRSGLERARIPGTALGRPRTRVTRDQVLALEPQGLKYRATAATSKFSLFWPIGSPQTSR